jgi:hypothetical protein
MSNKTVGIVGIILGIVMVAANVVVGLFGWLWLYSQFGWPSIGFGFRKISLIVIGVLFVIVGARLYILANKKETQ